MEEEEEEGYDSEEAAKIREYFLDEAVPLMSSAVGRAKWVLETHLGAAAARDPGAVAQLATQLVRVVHHNLTVAMLENGMARARTLRERQEIVAASYDVSAAVGDGEL